MKQHVLSITVNNKYGVLSRVAGAFNRRACNIDSFSSGRTDEDGSYRMIVAMSCDEVTADLIKRQLERLVDVKTIEELKKNEFEAQELVLVKVRHDLDKENRLSLVASTFGAEIIQQDKVYATLRLASKPVWIDAFLERMADFEVIASSRSGAIAV